MELGEGKLYYVTGREFGARCIIYGGKIYKMRYSVRNGEDRFSNVVYGRLIRFDGDVTESRELIGNRVSVEERRILDALESGNLDQRRVKVEVRE